MHRFWIREILGMILVLLGLALFYICVAMLLMPNPRIFEAPTLSIIGIVIFRGGIHLLKVAVAARVALATPAEMPKPIANVKQATSNPPWDW